MKLAEVLFVSSLLLLAGCSFGTFNQQSPQGHPKKIENVNQNSKHKNVDLSKQNDKAVKPITFNQSKDEIPLSQDEIQRLKNKTNWNVSPTFRSGEKDSKLTGIKNKVAFQSRDGDKWFAKKPKKSPWIFWGDTKDIKDKKFSLVAIHKQTGSVEKVLSNSPGNTFWTEPGGIMGPNLGGDAHIPAGMVFPRAGKWSLNVFLDDKLIGQVIIKVYK